MVLDLMDEYGRVTYPHATYKRTETFELLGFGGVIETVGAAPIVDIGEISVDALANFDDIDNIFNVILSGAEGVGIAVSEITQLVIETTFGIATTKLKIDEGEEVEKVVLFPTFGGGTPMRKVWGFPPGFPRLFLITTSGLGIDGYAFLFGWKDLSLVKLPLPNIYDHGALCIGNDSMDKLRREPSIINRHKIALEALYANAWNSDLITVDKKDRCRKLFRWDADGNQLPVDGDPMSVMYRIASPWASNLFIQIP